MSLLTRMLVGVDVTFPGPAALGRLGGEAATQGDHDERLEILNDKEGVWRCRTTFNCTEACPRGIEVTKAIQEVKRAMIARSV